jgi:hypothetical protein
MTGTGVDFCLVFITHFFSRNAFSSVERLYEHGEWRFQLLDSRLACLGWLGLFGSCGFTLYIPVLRLERDSFDVHLCTFDFDFLVLELDASP